MDSDARRRVDEIDQAIADAAWTVGGIEYLLSKGAPSLRNPAARDDPRSEAARRFQRRSVRTLEKMLAGLRAKVAELEAERAALGGGAGPPAPPLERAPPGEP